LESDKNTTLKRVKDLIEQGLRFLLLSDYLKKNEPELYEALQRASARHYTKELLDLVSSKAENLMKKLEELYRDRKIEDLIKKAIRTEMTSIYREMESRKKRGRTVEFLLFIGIVLHITFITAGWIKTAVFLDIVMLIPLYMLYREGN